MKLLTNAFNNKKDFLERNFYFRFLWVTSKNIKLIEKIICVEVLKFTARLIEVSYEFYSNNFSKWNRENSFSQSN